MRSYIGHRRRHGGATLLLSFISAGLAFGGCTGERTTPSAAPASVSSASSRAAETCVAGLVAPAGHATIVEIPSLGGSEVFVQDVNDDGIVVGSERAMDGLFHAFRHTDLGGLMDLGASGTSFASAIAADGTIAGHSDLGRSAGALFGYRYTPSGGQVQVCDTPCSIWDLNAHEQVVGLVVDPSSALRWEAFLQSPTTGLRRLGTLGGARSSASGINETGLVVGNAQVAGSSPTEVGHAFVYDVATGMRDLNALAGVAGAGWVLEAAIDVSASYVVGYGKLGGRTRPYRFDLTTNAVKLLGDLSDARDAFGWGVDAHGDVVGWSSLGDKLNEAFVYGANFGRRRLADFVDPADDWDLQQANALNERGVIVGWGYHKGAPRGFKLTFPLCAP